MNLVESLRANALVTSHIGTPSFGMTLKMCWFTIASGRYHLRDRRATTDHANNGPLRP